MANAFVAPEDIPIPGVSVVGPYLAILQDQVSLLLQTRKRAFPGAQPVSFLQGHLQELMQHNYFVCEKTDGLRFLLYATFNRAENKFETFLINRSNAYFYTKILLPTPPEPGRHQYTKFHNGTLLDGELIVDMEADGSTRTRFLVFDCLATCGKVLIDRPFTKRLGHFREFVLKPLERMRIERPDLIQRIPFEIEDKKMHLSYAVEQIFAEMPLLKHKSDGLIFTSSEDCYTLGTDQKILKWKPAEENSVDFLLRPQPDGSLSLCIWEGGRVHTHYSYLVELDPEVLLQLQHSDNRVIECNYHVDYPGNWRFMRWRFDKENANHTRTFDNVMQSIRYAVSREELVQLAPEVRTRWKEREANSQAAAQQQPPAAVTPTVHGGATHANGHGAAFPSRMVTGVRIGSDPALPGLRPTTILPDWNRCAYGADTVQETKLGLDPPFALKFTTGGDHYDDVATTEWGSENQVHDGPLSPRLVDEHGQFYALEEWKAVSTAHSGIGHDGGNEFGGSDGPDGPDGGLGYPDERGGGGATTIMHDDMPLDYDDEF
ncbi:mRNA capping enzyme, catalytic domain-containing protein [Blastocladiella britannica]|nr:mRNA capping enzyme, catalytic domain-containing protein [Blastocladiella britannica]